MYDLSLHTVVTQPHRQTEGHPLLVILVSAARFEVPPDRQTDGQTDR